ncbi:MAG: 2,3-diaminopropionate biosynthesis protein SbnB [Gammaproteobacteria bacterium]|nr:2,3-diaminopropionate biosynthesis protein SbnB [Gammaproteobacteria bacterium]MDH3411535.1 2,3-diaminopropionate biosynthesis protein SbnB [Gammaproteobacteria bacterium]
MTHNDSLLILRGPDIRELLEDKTDEILRAVSNAYCEHQVGHSFLPHSVFVRFPGREKERIIALPGYLGGDDEITGIKWIASFPKNLDRGLSRASAIMVLNSMETGRPEFVLEASTISAYRTAASAALAADTLHPKGDIDALGVIGCGLINGQIVRFVASLQRKIGKVFLYDIDPARAATYREVLSPVLGNVPVQTCATPEDVMAKSAVISFATTAVQPSIAGISLCRPAATILHISLRDLMPDAILGADNVVDDVDHVMRAQTSVHLAQQKVGNHDFVRCTLAEIILRRQPARRDDSSVTVFSPFGLGVLDLAVAKLAVEYAQAAESGIRVSDFFKGT